jgi:hypothetical protein
VIEFDGTRVIEFYDYDGEPMTIDEWEDAFQSNERFLKQEWVLKRDGKRYWISTVWLGIDHNFMSRSRSLAPYEVEALGDIYGYDTRPWIYETMAFDNRPGFTDIFARVGDEVTQVRDATRKEALATHERVKREL